MPTGSVRSTWCAVPGVRLASAACGLKADGRDDLVLIGFSQGSETAAVFTRNLFAAAPVEICKRHLGIASPRYFLINSGNANAATGSSGMADALACCNAVAAVSGTDPERILPFSTGVIGERLPVSKITDEVEDLFSQLSDDGWLRAAKAIMTTDTIPKVSSRQIDTGAGQASLCGMVKGAGMIQPDMATMLCFVCTDVRASRETLQGLLEHAVNRSFNRITVDSDTSTNDSCTLTATGLSGVDIDRDSGARTMFSEALESLMVELAQGIIRDAEGATRFVEIRVINGDCEEDCLKVAFSIANSPLVKTAFFAGDANWGRIVMAIGKSGARIDPSRVDIRIGDAGLMKNGGRDPDYTESAGTAAMAGEEIGLTVDLKSGDCSATVWTSDLSHEYIRINAEYRT